VDSDRGSVVGGGAFFVVAVDVIADVLDRAGVLVSGRKIHQSGITVDFTSIGVHGGNFKYQTVVISSGKVKREI